MTDRSSGERGDGTETACESDGAPSRGGDGVSRRTYCRVLAGGAVTAAGIGNVVRAAGIEDEYGTVIDVADAGAATDGSQSVSGLLQELAGDDTLLRFPAGRYYMDQEVRVTSFRDLGLVGEDATLVPADYWTYDAPNYRLFRFGTSDLPGDGLRFEGFTVDQQTANTGIRAIEAQVKGGLHVENVDVVGRHDTGTWGPGLFTITEPDGTGLVRGFRAPDGAEASVDTPGDIRYGPTGILCNAPHEGSITFEDCVLGAFPDNGLYAAGGSGEIHVVGGRYDNSGTASLRLGCDRGSITGATVNVHEDPFGLGREGIRIQYGNWMDLRDVTVHASGPIGEAVRVLGGVEGGRLSNCTIVMNSPGHSTGILVGQAAGRIRITNSTVQNDGQGDSGGYGIMLKGTDNAAGAHVENITIDGDVGDDGGRAGIYNRRDNVRVIGTTVAQSGGRKRAALVNTGADCTIYRCSFRATRYPIKERGTGTWIQDVYTESYDGAAGISLHDGARAVYLMDSTISGGLRDVGAEAVTVENVSGL